MNILSSALGNYEIVGDLLEADLLIGHSFGTVISEAGVNHALASYILEHADGRPIVADRMLVDAFPNGDEDVDFVVEGSISNSTGQGVGTWGTLVGAKAFMERRGLQKPLMVAQAHHVGRVAMQGRKLGISSVVPEGLPAQFDSNSDQRWTRSVGLWVPREIVGSFVLRVQGKL